MEVWAMEVLMDYIEQVNWFVVFLAALAAFVVGAVWYSRSVFGKTWMKAAGITEKDVKKGSMTITMGGGFIALFIVATALNVLYDVFQLSGMWSGMLLGLLVGGGFVVTLRIMHSLFELRPPQYIVISGLGDMAMLAVMGTVLGIL